MTATLIVLLIITLSAIVFLPFSRALMKDRAELHENPLEQKFNILITHISTHGFFHDSGTFINPMQNSGLLFANSQKYWVKDSLASSINESDGILRADEIARLDLSGCRLVVLSACQTGLGEYNSEGVYGLQRAFKLAGAQSVLMSLWSVDDKATSELMIEFYKGLLTGKEPDESLVSVQRVLRSKGYSPDKWAAFVLLN